MIIELVCDTRAKMGTEDRMGEVLRVQFTVIRACSKYDRGYAVSSVSSRIVAAGTSGMAGVTRLDLGVDQLLGARSYHSCRFLGVFSCCVSGL